MIISELFLWAVLFTFLCIIYNLSLIGSLLMLFLFLTSSQVRKKGDQLVCLPWIPPGEEYQDQSWILDPSQSRRVRLLMTLRLVKRLWCVFLCEILSNLDLFRSSLVPSLFGFNICSHLLFPLCMLVSEPTSVTKFFLIGTSAINLFSYLDCMMSWYSSCQTPIYWLAQVDRQGELLFLAAVMHLLEVNLISIALVQLKQALVQRIEFQVGKEVHLLVALRKPSAHYLGEIPLT